MKNLSWPALSLAGLLAGLAACQSAPPSPSESRAPASEPEAAADVMPAGDAPVAAAPQGSDAPAREQQVKVFFPKPTAESAVYVEPVWRATASAGVAQFALDQLLAGPRPAEAELGLKSVLPLTGASNCGGEDFQIAIADQRADVQFCRELAARDAVDLRRLTEAIEATLTQFNTVEQVALRDRQGKCLTERCPTGTAQAATPAAAKALTTDDRLTLTRLGALEIGMTLDEAAQATGSRFEQQASGGEEYGCLYFRPANGPAGVSLMAIDGEIARIDIDSEQIATLSGIRIGDSAAKVRRAYGDRLETSPHEYVPGGEYLIFRPEDAASQDYRVVFETDASGRVTRMRNGRRPAVLAVEGCV